MHDYNDLGFNGIKEEKEVFETIPRAPLPDSGVQ